jgi:transcriptional regulator with XRE-family HTH domain
MKTILGERLKQARIMKGLSLRGLSDALNGLVSYNALSKYEKGEMMPSSKVLISLANTLERNPDFFFRPLTVSFSGLEFRKFKTKLSKTDENRIREESHDFFERYLIYC